MKIVVKTLSQESFNVEIEPEAKVKEFKEAIEKMKGSSFPAAGQKLIYAGKILNDDQPLSEYKIDEKGFVVVMVTKPKAAESKPAAEPAPAAPAATPSEPPVQPPTQPAAPEAPPAAAQQAAADPPAAAPAAASGTEAAAGADQQVPMGNMLLTGSAFEQAVTGIVAMGFPRDQVVAAMRASFNNPDRAIEYLLSGEIPVIEAGAEPPAAGGAAPEAPAAPAAAQEGAPPAAPAAAPAGSATGTAQAAGSGASARDLEFLRSQPQFEQLRQLVRQSPDALPLLLQQLGQTNPQLLQLISANQEQFIAMLNEAPAEEGGAPPAAGGGTPPGSNVIQVSTEEKEAIDRLKALGFSEAMCLQAYFACDKNENLAANFLLQQQMEDDDDFQS